MPTIVAGMSAETGPRRNPAAHSTPTRTGAATATREAAVVGAGRVTSVWYPIGVHGIPGRGIGQEEGRPSAILSGPGLRPGPRSLSRRGGRAPTRRRVPPARHG